MDLTGSWEYLQEVASRRLSKNKTPRHVYRYGTEIEVLGAAGELAARRFLGLPEELHANFDHGTDILWHGLSVDVKATVLTPRIAYRYLQWPEWKYVKADIVIMTAVDLRDKQATVLGYALRSDVLSAPINRERDTPCHEIPVPDLRPAWQLSVMYSDDQWNYTH